MAEKDNTALFLGLGLAAAAAALFAGSQTETVQTYIRDTVSDLTNNYRINLLHPKVRQAARNFINAAEKAGIHLAVTSTLRTFAEQQALYNQGRTTPGSIVTNAKPGYSYHNYGLALDVVEIKDGKAYGFTKEYPLQRWADLAKYGKAAGFTWGGDFTGTFKDRPHFEMRFGKTEAQLLSLYNSGNRIGDYVII